MNLNQKLNYKLKNHMDLITKWEVKDNVIYLSFRYLRHLKYIKEQLIDSKYFAVCMIPNYGYQGVSRLRIKEVI